VLPELKFTRKAPRSMRRVVDDGNGVDDPKVISDKVARRLMALQDEIQALREEYDFLAGQKTTLNRRLEEVKVHYSELKRMDRVNSEFDKDLERIVKREEDLIKKHERAQVIHKNLESVLLMCRRHPPENPALVSEVERKIEQDEFLLREIKARLWEQKFERQSHAAIYPRMKALVQEGADMHTKLLKYRYGMKRYLQTQAAEDTRIIQQRSLKSGSAKSSTRLISRELVEGEENLDPYEEEARASNWQRTWQQISQRTGITDPDIFFARLNNG